MPEAVRIIVAGGRDFSDYQLVADTLDSLIHALGTDDITIVSGGCRGADSLGERYAKEHGLTLAVFPADWKRYGRAAGPMRNRRMAEFASEKHGILTAFWDGTSRGTASMIRLAGQCGIETVITKY